MSELENLARAAALRIDTEVLTMTHVDGMVWRRKAAAIMAETFAPLAERAAKLEAALRQIGELRQSSQEPYQDAFLVAQRIVRAALLTPVPPQVFPEAQADDDAETIRQMERADQPQPAWEVELRYGELHRANPFVRAAVAEITRLRAVTAPPVPYCVCPECKLKFAVWFNGHFSIVPPLCPFCGADLEEDDYE